MSQPIIIKNATDHWPAQAHLTIQHMKQIYERFSNRIKSFEDECQFLPFKSSFGSLCEFFLSTESPVERRDSSWYIGFSNCQSNILNELRRLYPMPHFLPEDAEIPNTDYIFLGYDEGAVMHVSSF